MNFFHFMVPLLAKWADPTFIVRFIRDLVLIFVFFRDLSAFELVVFVIVVYVFPRLFPTFFNELPKC